MGWLRRRYGMLVSYDWAPLIVYRGQGEDGRWRWAVYDESKREALPVEYGEAGDVNVCRREAVASARRVAREKGYTEACGYGVGL